MAIRHGLLISMVTLCCNLCIQPANGQEYPWDGPCGVPIPPPPRKWIRHVQEESYQPVHLAHQYLYPLYAEDIARFNPWLGLIKRRSDWGEDIVGVLVLIRAKVGEEESDIGIGAARTCDDMQIVMNHDRVTVIFGAHDHVHGGVHEVAIEDCFIPDHNGVAHEGKDISVFKFSETVKFKTNTYPGCLARATEVIEVDTPGYVAEWANIFVPAVRAFVPSLRMLPFQVIHDTFCTVHAAVIPVNDKFCIGKWERHTDPVNGRERHGIFVTSQNSKLVIHGVYHFISNGPIHERLPTSVTRIADHFDWLQTTIREESALYDNA